MKMKSKVRFLVFALFLAALIAIVTPSLRPSAAERGRAECAVEVSSRRILHECNAETPLPMASTTKILTAILILDDCDVSKAVTIPKAAEGVEGSSVYLRAGETYTVLELLYGLMLRSGNDCAVTLALHHSGSIARFAQAMNEKAALIGATDSFFVNPHGLPDERHHTTARDLALIAAYAMENETFREIVSCKYFAPRGWKNKNKMLDRYEGAIGVKTGFTAAAGRCLVTCAERNGMRVVTVVLNCPEMYERTEELLDEVFSAFALAPLYQSDVPFEGFRIKENFSYPLTAEERRAVRYTTDCKDPLPEKSGEIAGQTSVYLANSLLFSQNLYIV